MWPYASMFQFLAQFRARTKLAELISSQGKTLLTIFRAVQVELTAANTVGRTVLLQAFRKFMIKYAIVPCSNADCTDTVERQSIKRHLEDCAHTEVSCKYQKIGCNVKIKRSAVSAHVASTFRWQRMQSSLWEKKLLPLTMPWKKMPP